LRRADVEAAGLMYYGVGRPPAWDSSHVVVLEHAR